MIKKKCDSAARQLVPPSKIVDAAPWMPLVRCATAGRKPWLVKHVAIMLCRVSNLPLATHHLSARAWHASIFLHTIFAHFCTLCI